jgi:hypothetical protein
MLFATKAMVMGSVQEVKCALMKENPDNLPAHPKTIVIDETK